MGLKEFRDNLLSGGKEFLFIITVMCIFGGIIAPSIAAMFFGVTVVSFFYYSRLKKDKNFIFLVQRDVVLVVLAKQGAEDDKYLFPKLFSLEKDNYPVLQVLSEVYRNDLASAYYEYLVQQWKDCSIPVVDVSSIHSSKKAAEAVENLAIIKSLPTWKFHAKTESPSWPQPAETDGSLPATSKKGSGTAEPFVSVN